LVVDVVGATVVVVGFTVVEVVDVEVDVDVDVDVDVEVEVVVGMVVVRNGPDTS
jgi:hypothetical protein